MRRREFVRGSALAAGGAALAPVLAWAQDKTLVTGSFGPAGTLYAPFMVVETEGFARAEGLDFKIVISDGGSRTRQMVAAGQVSHAHGDAVHPLQLSNRGKPCKILMGTEARCPYANIVIRKDLFDQGIDTPEKFGHWKRPDGSKPRIAASALGSGSWMYGNYVLEQFGVADRVTWVNGGGSKTILGGLQSKQFDAIVANAANQLDAEDHGWGRVIYDVRDKAAWDRAFGGPIPTTAVYALAATVEAAPDVTQAFVNAVCRAMQWLKAHSVDEIYARLGEKYLGDVAPKSRKHEIAFFKQLWKYDGIMSEADFKNGGRVWFREGTDIKPISFADVVDARFIVNAHKKLG